MNAAATGAALAALRYWAAQAGAGEAVWDSPEQRELVRQAACLVKGNPVADNDWPEIKSGEPLLSIFSRIKPKEGGPPPPEIYIRRASLALSEQALFPCSRQEAATLAGPDPIESLKQQVGELEQRGLPAELHLEELLYALQRHAWCLPSPLEAVSLYDFARTHAAVAAARAVHAGDLFLLGGDLSGVQSFLYTLTAAGATKQLRGRSFYLQLLTEACAHYVLTKAGLPLTNLLYAGGGRFYALLPGQIEGILATEWLKAQRKDFDDFFFYQHQGDLYLALGGGVVQEDDLRDTKRFSDAWGKATEAINTAKRRRFADLGAELFAPQGHGGNEDDACIVCGYQGDTRDLKPIEGNPLGRRRCRLCDSFEDLGRLLHNAEYLLLHHRERPSPQPPNRRLSWDEVLDELGIYVQLSRKHARLGEPGNADPSWPVRWTTALALEDGVEPPELSGPVVRGFRPMANTTPTMHPADMQYWKPQEDGEQKPEEGDVKPFSVMVAQSRGVKRLGVLRMDVDDLGDLFRYRLDTGLARVSALSAALALFFEGWVGHVCDQVNLDDPDQRGSVYTIYSGGDDLFIVGSWHLLPDLARRISDDLAAYTGRNPLVHVSAGISLHGAKFPLYQAAEAADKELKRAKSRIDQNGKPKKAALGWLDQVVGWEYAPKLFALVDELRGYAESQGLSRAVLQILQQLYVQYDSTQYINGKKAPRRGKKSAKFVYGPWVWRRMYQLTRIAEQVRHNDKGVEKEVKTWVYNLRDTMLEGVDRPANTGGRAIERVGLAARWTQLLIRKEQRNATGE